MFVLLLSMPLMSLVFLLEDKDKTDYRECQAYGPNYEQRKCVRMDQKTLREERKIKILDLRKNEHPTQGLLTEQEKSVYSRDLGHRAIIRHVKDKFQKNIRP
jgi:hypothetical protein